MTQQATGTIEVTRWDEQPYEDIEGGRRLTSTTIRQQLSGDIEGVGTATWLTSYRPDGTAEYTGYQRIVGTIGGASGSIVMRMTGGYDGTTASSEWSVLPGMGTGDLANLSGSGGNESDREGRNVYTLDYELT